eukprot:UN33797
MIERFEFKLESFQECAVELKYNNQCYDTVRIKKFCHWDDLEQQVPLENWYLPLQKRSILRGTKTYKRFIKLGQQKLNKTNIEIVLARYDESVYWNRMYEDITTVYNKGSYLEGDNVIELENVGREGHTFLTHVVRNWDNLADWTIFSQAQCPTFGYLGHRQGSNRGGHMVPGTSWDDYVLAFYDEQHLEYKGYMTEAFNLKDQLHKSRSIWFHHGRLFESEYSPYMYDFPMCPARNRMDHWEKQRTLGKFGSYLKKKQYDQHNETLITIADYWHDYIQLPIPYNNVIYYAQG